MNPSEVAPGCPIITQAYGCTNFAGEWYVPPSVCSSGWFHDGVDLAGSNCCDTPLLAAGAGTIQAIGQTWNGSGGLGPGSILLRMDDGVFAGYGHGYAEVSVGQRVTKGQRIGRVGTQGFSTGCHLHLTIRTQLGTVPAGCINPLTYNGPGAAAPPPPPPPKWPRYRNSNSEEGAMYAVINKEDGTVLIPDCYDNPGNDPPITTWVTLVSDKGATVTYSAYWQDGKWAGGNTGPLAASVHGVTGAKTFAFNGNAMFKIVGAWTAAIQVEDGGPVTVTKRIQWG